MTIRTAMVLAAGLGTRMRPITDHTPKPLVAVGGETLLDRALDAALAAGCSRAVVNVHHLADRIEAHLRARGDLEVAVSDERERLMDSGGALAHARERLGDAPFLVLNGDTFWREARPGGNVGRMAAALDADADMVLLLARHDQAVGFAGRGDFLLDESGRLERRGARESAPYVYAGAIVMRPHLLQDVPNGPFSLNLLFDRLLAEGRLRGVPMDGLWLHVGTPDAIGKAEAALAAFERVAS